MRVLLLLHRISPPCSPSKCLLRSLYGPDQRRRLQIRNNPTGSWSAKMSTRVKEGVTFDTPFRATGWSKTSRHGLRVFANIRSKSVCREGPQSDSHRVTIPPSASSLLFAVSVHLLPLQDHLIQLLQARLQALAIQS